MKKTIGIILMVMVSLGCYCQDSASKQIPDTSKVTWTKVYNDVKGSLVGIGAALKTSAEHVYAVLIKQQLVNSIINLVLLIVSIGFIIASFKLVKYLVGLDDIEDQVGVIVLAIAVCGGTIVLTIYVLVDLPQTITGFFNPEYGALKDIMGFVK